MRSLGLCLLLSFSLFTLAPDANAMTQSFGFVGPIQGEDGFVADVDLMFDFDPTCTTGCTLGIMVTYNDVGGIPDQGKAFSTVVFSVSGGSITFDRSNSQVLAETLVGSDLGSVVIPMVGSAYDVTPQFALDPAVALGPGYGTIALGSVGDILFGLDTLGNADLLPGTPIGELNPPDGWPYTLVDASTTGFKNNGNKFDVLIQTKWTASLAYDGQISGVTNVSPLFGTDGAPLIPEPSAAHLFPIGLLVAGVAYRRRRSRAAA